jgi:hypothetical protein
MTSFKLKGLLTAGVAMIASASCNRAAAPAGNSGQTSTAPSNETTSSSDPVASAESAAPASLAHNASIVTADANGNMTVVRKGSNGWTCMPDSPTTPGPDPMCFDANAGKWIDAMLHHKPPPEGTVGMVYMLEGGTDASNTDPYATRPTAENDWIKTGPHVMVVGSKALLAGYPGGAKPDTAVPYVMWSGTPYAHLMVPVNKG